MIKNILFEIRLFSLCIQNKVKRCTFYFFAFMSLQHCWLVEFVNMQANALWKRFTFSENFALFPMFE